MGIFSSSTSSIPEVLEVPRHIAVIMDGNGRWAKKRFLPRVAGHKVGVETVRSMIKHCVDIGVEYLTLFAFSSENWRRPPEEVSFLMGLFMEALKKEVVKLHKNNVRFVMIVDRSASFFVGDKTLDVECGLRAGLRKIEVLVDADDGIRIHQCAYLSRRLRERFEGDDELLELV